MKDKKILLNSIQCNHCEDIIISRYTHDYVTCKCGQVSVDGGLSYLKRAFHYEDDYKELSKYDDGKHSTRRKYCYWGRSLDKNGRRLKEIKWILIKDLDTDHIENILENVLSIDPFYKKVFKRELLYRENKNI